MKTIKELEVQKKSITTKEDVGYYEALKDVLELIDELKTRITG